MLIGRSLSSVRSRSASSKALLYEPADTKCSAKQRCRLAFQCTLFTQPGQRLSHVCVVSAPMLPFLLLVNYAKVNYVKGSINEERIFCLRCTHRLLGCQQRELQEPLWRGLHRDVLCLPHRLQST